MTESCWEQSYFRTKCLRTRLVWWVFFFYAFFFLIFLNNRLTKQGSHHNKRGGKKEVPEMTWMVKQVFDHLNVSLVVWTSCAALGEFILQSSQAQKHEYISMWGGQHWPDQRSTLAHISFPNAASSSVDSRNDDHNKHAVILLQQTH